MAAPGKTKFYSHLDEQTRSYNATKETHDMDKRKSVTDHDHYFVQVAGDKVQCNCGWGFNVGVQDVLTEGHLYSNGKKII